MVPCCGRGGAAATNLPNVYDIARLRPLAPHCAAPQTEPASAPEKMSLSPDDVRKVARLARLAIADGDIPPTLDTLNRTLMLVEQMAAVDTSGVEPMAHAHDVSLRLRPDAVTEPDRREALMANAPAAEKGLFLVPKVIE